MKFDEELQNKLSELCQNEILREPYRKQEFENEYDSIKIQIYELIGASHALGLDLSTLEAYLIWSCLSSDFGCSGWMTVDAKLLQHAIAIYCRN